MTAVKEKLTPAESETELDGERCDHCGKPECFGVLCAECEQLVCDGCGRVECCCEVLP